MGAFYIYNMPTLQALPKLRLRQNKHFDDHLGVWRFEDKKTGLLGFVAIHRKSDKKTSLSGTRFFPYKNEREALNDVLMLSRAMSYKCAISKLPFTGGKAVIIGDPQKIKTHTLLASYARVISELRGMFYTGEDVGIDKNDVRFLLTKTPYFVGKHDLTSGPSPYAALSVYRIMRAAMKEVFPQRSLEDLTVAIKGVGKVGGTLAAMLAKDNMRVIVADTENKTISTIKKKIRKISSVSPQNILKLKMDIYAPCAMGGEFTIKNISHLQARLICGAANNQITSPKIAQLLHKRGIIFIPDYLANAGGLINVADELEPGGYNKKRVIRRIKDLEKTFYSLYEEACRSNKSIYEVAEVFSIRSVNFRKKP